MGSSAALLLLLAVYLGGAPTSRAAVPLPATLPAAAPAAAPASDAAAMLQLKAALTGGTVGALSNWVAGSDPCSITAPWSGVACVGGRVSAITLPGYALSGSLPASLNLPELELLDLNANQLDGTLPATLALPRLQRFNLGGNLLMGTLPVSWALNFPSLEDLTLRNNRLAGTLPPAWVAEPAFATPFRAVLQPGNPLLCGAVSPAPNYTLWYSDAANGAAEHEILTTLGSCAQNANCGVAGVNTSAPNLYDLSWSNRVATLDLEYLNPGVQRNGAPKLGSPVTLPCYPSNQPAFFGADAAYQKATWQSSTDGAFTSDLPVSGNRRPTTAEQCSATAEGPAYWMVDLQRDTQVLAVLIRAGPLQMQGVAIRVSETPDPSSGAICKTNITFDPNQGKIFVCERPNQGRYVSISAQSVLSLCVVEVYPLVSNAALGKATTASAGDADTTQSGQVVNGNMANTVCSSVVSGSNLAAWITIDLGYEAAVETVVVQNGFSSFQNDLVVRLGDNPVANGDENEVCSQAQTLGPRLTLPIQCVGADGQPAKGRFLTLYRKVDQASDMYICQVLVFLSAGPAKFYLSPPAPPSPPFAPPPSPSPPSPSVPSVIDASVVASTIAMAVKFDITGSGLVPLTSGTEQNIVLAANNTWTGQFGITGVEAVEFGASQPAGGPSFVSPKLRVAVNAGWAPRAAAFIVGTSDDGSLENAMNDQGGQLANVTGTTMTSITAVSTLPPSSPSPAPAPSPDGGNTADTGSGGSSTPTGAIVGGVIGGLALVAALLGGWAVMRRRRRMVPGSPQLHENGVDSPKALGAMEQGRGSPLFDLPKPSDVSSGYNVAALAAGPARSGSLSAHLKLAGEPMTQGPPAEVISFLADDAVSDHSAMIGQPLARDSPSGWGGSSTGGGSVAGAAAGSVARTASDGGLAAAALAKQKSAPNRSGVSELWTVDFRELAIQKQIGEGSFGKVYLAKWRETTVAVKVLGNCGSGNSPGLDDEFPDAAAAKGHPLYESLQKEAAMMASLRHPSIVMYLGVCLDPPAVVTEYCARGSLNDVLKRARTSPLLAAQLDWARRLNMALDAAKGMLYLHSCAPPIIHRDLKSANLLVDKHWRVRVCDFNLSRVMEDSAVLSSVAATNPRWLAPEILSGKGYTKLSDVYSFGICMWELLTWQVPYYEFGPWQVVAMVTENAKRPEIPSAEDLPSGSFSGDAEYLALMQECWAQDPEERPTFAAIISRLRSMLANEASIRRDSPTKGMRAHSSTLSVSVGSGGMASGLGAAASAGEETPLARSRVASTELGGSPDLRGPGSDLLSGSPGVLDRPNIVGSLALAASGQEQRHRLSVDGGSRAGLGRQLSSIPGGGTDDAKTERLSLEASAATSLAAASSQQQRS